MSLSTFNRAICTSVRARSGHHSGQPSKRFLPEPGAWGATLAAIAGLMVFVGAARSFGAPSWVKSAIIGFILVLLAYFGFARLLGLRMGEGIIESLI